MSSKKTKYDSISRELYNHIEMRFYFYKSIEKEMTSPKYSKLTQSFKSTLFFAKLNFKNYCIITGRSRSIYKKFKISRLQIRVLANKLFIPGLQKSS